MSEPYSPGQIAYEAYSANIANPYYYAWERLGPYEHRAWEAAAHAVLDAWQAQPRMEDTTP